MRGLSLAAVFALLALAPAASTAYVTELANGNLIRWGPGSPAAIWNDATKTLNWSFNPINFPQATWPSAEQAGAAFQNAFQTYEDVAGSSFKQNRLPDSNGTPSSNDGKVEMTLAPNQASAYFGPITGAFAVAYVRWNAATGALTDADIVFNGDPATFPRWSTLETPPQPSNDIEVTQLHEGLHAVGGGHPIYLFAAVWPTGRFPEHTTIDRCLSSDDRVLLRTLYPEAPALGTITGQVNLSTGGGADRAVVVATDANGVPQATQVTTGSGAYSVNVPAGTYSLTVHHHSNLDYDADIDFFSGGGADDFVNAGTAAGVAVTAGNSTVAGTISAQAGTPSLFFAAYSVAPAPPDSQVLFLPKGSSGSAQFVFPGVSFGTAEIQSVSFGPGITIGAPAAAAGGGGSVIVSVPYTVLGGATPGLRTVELVLTSGERALLPSGVFILDSGALTLSAGPANPAAGGAAPGSADAPLLQVTLAASAVEDVRVRRLTFSLAGSGPLLPAVRLWRDVDGGGTLDAGDVRVFSGTAYASSPIAETQTGATGGTVVFDNLSLPVLAGTSVQLLLTADLPGAGSGTYTASLAPSGVLATGMYYGDVLTTGGGTATGGTQTLSSVNVASPEQIRTTGGASLAIGSFTTETQVTIRAVAAASSGSLGIEAEVKPLGVAFTGAGTSSSATTFPSGSAISVNVTGLSNQTSYHWRVRALSDTLPPGPWLSFGGNAETAVDFSVDTSTTSAPTALGQFEAAGAPAVPVGGTVRGSIRLSALNGTNSAGAQVRLEVEVVPSGTAFTNTPTLSAALLPGGALASVLFAAGSDTYHWQARSVGQFGAASAWVAFDPAPIHFQLEAAELLTASGGCVGQSSGGGLPWAALALALVSFLAFRRKVSKGAVAALVLLAAAGAARADVPTRLELFEAAPSKPWGSVGVYAGLLFFDSEFEAEGADFTRRELDDTGMATLGVDARVNLHPDWSVGATLELGMSSDVRILGVGPHVNWRFAASREARGARRPDTEHFARLGFLYQTLEVDPSGFGDFDPALGLRLGYEFRYTLAERWSITVGVELRHAVWDYDESVSSGDEELGGAGALISVGIAFLP